MKRSRTEKEPDGPKRSGIAKERDNKGAGLKNERKIKERDLKGVKMITSETLGEWD